MNKMVLAFGLVALFLFFCGQVSADEPSWLKRVELSGQWETDQNPNLYFQTVQPLYQDASEVNTVFIQPRFSYKSEHWTGNLGIGYRKIVSDNLLLGANIFGDYQDLHSHGRLGAGFEALGQIWEARLNGYLGLTETRIINDTTYERVADGADFELGAPIPYAPWLKIYGSGFWYNFDNFKDKRGWKGRLEAKLNKAITLEGYAWDDNKGDVEYGGRLRCNLVFDKLCDFKDAFKLSNQPFPKKDLKETNLIPVERSYEITLETWSASGTTTIEIGRDN